MVYANEITFEKRSTTGLISTQNDTGRALALPVVFFLISLILPFVLPLGGLRLSVYRIVLIIMTIPLLVMWLRGQAGTKRLADFALLLLCIWMTLSVAVVDSPQRALEAGGIFFCETFGAFLMGRCLVRSEKNFHRVALILFAIVMFLMPFAIIEAITGRNVILEFMSKIWPSYSRVAKNPRWGLDRVQGTFEHPILFGVFCGSAIGLAYMVLGYGKSFFRRIMLGLLVMFTAGLSLSAGPLTGMVVQIEMAIWNEVLAKFRARWKVLAALTALAYIAIEIGSDRSAPAVFISYFSFNEYSAYMRLHIWNFGTLSIVNHPLFGIGFAEWARPSWMSSSIDMFWIVFGVRHGIPAMILTLLTFFAVYLPLAFRKNLPDRAASYRLGVIFTLTAFFLTGWTVHYWNATYVLFMFLLGASVWILNVPDKGTGDSPPDTESQDSAPHSKSAYTRFPHKHKRRATTAGKTGTLALACATILVTTIPNVLSASETLHVSNKRELSRALRGAQGGEHIFLADGNYGALRIDGLAFDPPVTMQSEFGRNARFTSISLNDAHGIRIESVHVDHPRNRGRNDALVEIVGGSQNIEFRNSEINAKVDSDFPDFVALLTGGSVRDITFADNIIHDVKRGGLFMAVQGLVLRGNTVDRIGEDSFKFIAVQDVLIENNTGARLVYPQKGYHLDFIQFQGAPSSGITIRGNVSLPGNEAAATVQGIFLDDAHYSDVLIERNVIVTGMIRGVSLSEGTNVVARYNTVLDIEGIGSKATKVMVDGQSYGNIMGSYSNDKELGLGQNLVLQQTDPSGDWHYDSVFRNADHGLGITLEDLQPVPNGLAKEFGAYQNSTP
ncbi:hypothetical protein [Primorskyibacter sp. 2E233]|uniref:hypothetical protein n=1 Tax=Primorskyibacter sp. 2E233 TaxID=3413431 RepID=UPI003BF41279